MLVIKSGGVAPYVAIRGMVALLSLRASLCGPLLTLVFSLLLVLLLLPELSVAGKSKTFLGANANNFSPQDQ